MFYDEPPQFLASSRFEPTQAADPDSMVISMRRKVMGHDLNMKYHFKDDTLHVKRSDFIELCEKTGTTLAATLPKLHHKIILY